MAKRSGGIENEYSGTGNESDGPVVGTSEPLAPDAAAGITPADGPGDFDARIHVGPDARNADGSYTKRRGRKSGSSNGSSSGPRKTQTAADLNRAIEGLAKTLVILHVGIAGVTGTPEIAIDENEADMLARASSNVLEQFDLKPDPKVQAIVGLIMAAGTVYGPRVYLIQSRKAQEKAERKAGANGAGVAGVYNADGQPVGTTEFSVQ